MKKLLVDFKNNQQGNIAMMFGITLVMLVGSLAVALDLSKAYQLRSSLTDIADAAALAGAYVATTDGENREAVVQKIIDFHLAELPSNINNLTPSITFDDATSELTVTLNGQVEASFASLIGFSKLDVTGQSATTYTQNDISPISMAFVLDVSGSMNRSSSSGGSKLNALKNAVSSMFDVIEDTAPRKDILNQKMRTGMTAFNIALVDAHTVPMEFGSLGVENRVASLNAGGDTNTTPAFALALNMLENDTPKPGNLAEYIILMTDGKNDFEVDNGNTLDLCDQAKAQGITVYSIAFEAPQVGQDLLRGCASGEVDFSGSETGLENLSDTSLENHTNQFYFDAQNAIELEAAFRQIGEDIGNFETRIIR